MRPLFGRIVLNQGAADPAPAAGGASEVAERLQRAMLGVIGAFTRGDGRLEYRALRASPEWAAAAAGADALAAVRPADLAGRDARLAFWINVYNALVFHGVVVLDVRRTVREVRGFFLRVAYAISARPCDAYRAYDWALQHQPAE